MYMYFSFFFFHKKLVFHVNRRFASFTGPRIFFPCCCMVSFTLRVSINISPLAID